MLRVKRLQLGKTFAHFVIFLVHYIGFFVSSSVSEFSDRSIGVARQESSKNGRRANKGKARFAANVHKK